MFYGVLNKNLIFALEMFLQESRNKVMIFVMLISSEYAVAYMTLLNYLHFEHENYI